MPDLPLKQRQEQRIIEKKNAIKENLPENHPLRREMEMTEEQKAQGVLDSCAASIDAIETILLKDYVGPFDLDVIRRNVKHLELSLQNECVQNCNLPTEQVETTISAAKQFLLSHE